MGIKAKPEDWFLGVTPQERGDKIVYAMEVAEVISFEEYDSDPRFDAKKPVMNAPWKQRCGDNLYYRDEEGKWQQRPNPFHDTPRNRKQDLRHPSVFISEHFYYFGENAVRMPLMFADLIWRRQGCKCSHEREVVAGFVNWLQDNFRPGIHGDPWDKFRTLFLHENVQTEAVSIHFEHFSANRGHFYSDFGS
jgi:hypothetical protein